MFKLMMIICKICWPITWSHDGQFLWYLWNHIPMDNMNKALAVHALTTLALCYLPGVLAGWLQLYRGTKYSRFPNWLDTWLKIRKQLGLLMLFAASIHVRKRSSIIQACFPKFLTANSLKISMASDPTP